MKKNFPYKLEKNPLLEAVVEIRFESNYPDGSIIGILYNKLKDSFGKYVELPHLQIPEHIRKQDKNFEFAPLYKFDNGIYQINVGDKVISILDRKEYSGWDNYKLQITKIVNILSEIELISKVLRIGVRYIDFFENVNIQDKIKLKISGSPFDIKQTTIATSLKISTFEVNLLIAEANQILVDEQLLNGSIIDSDIYCNFGKSMNDSEIMSEINSAHDIAKEVFFNILEDDYIKELNPTYKKES